jgi:serine/threonine protein kinase/tetratricopeptide (TPR) repeat protein
VNGERWERLNQVFHAAVELAPEQRAGFLDYACSHDPGLRAEVERLVAAHERAGPFIEGPAIAEAGPWLRDTTEPVPTGHRFGPYRVIREIGRGGMGAVYLAERADGQFEQQVALKLIKRGMDTDLVLQRFRAERQILASLDHPNIARLLDGGTTEDGRPYFVMEYIEGEPLDEYADARRLSIPERLRLFLTVCGAVAYAHQGRVVHRDIKPLNILVTHQGVPKLLDFGIAKVLQTGADEPTSSVTGFRLLTPEYASPEQVEGRHATTVSDVYSLGVVLYEVLTGHSPYRSKSHEPADVVEAVRTTDPERPSTAVVRGGAEEDTRRRPGLARDRAAATGAGSTVRLSRRLRGDLDTIVLMALRKEPARRYQSVEQLAEDIRRHLEGLPVRARRDTVRYRAGKFLRRNRASIATAALAGVLVLLPVAGFVAFYAATNRRSDPSLVETRVLAPRDRLVVADFQNRAGDSVLAQAVTEAFRVDLAQSPLVQVFTPREVRVSLARMERSADVALDDSLAREVAVREGVKAFVTGGVARVGGSYTVTVQLMNARSGEALAGVRETAVDSSQLIAAIDRASKAIRYRIGESLRDLRKTPALEQVTTRSLPALRKYTEGYRLFLAGERTRALPLYQQAVALDTGFAMAYFTIASTYGALAEPGRAWAAARHALANQARLPFLERRLLVAAHAYGSGDYETSVAEYHRLLERYPENVAFVNNLALAYRDWRRFATAESLYRRATQMDSTIATLYFGLHSAQVFQGKFADSRRTLGLIRRRFPNDPILHVVEVQDAAAHQSWDEAERIARANIAARPRDTLYLVDAYEALAGIVMTRGRLAEAERHWGTQLAMSAASGSWGRRLFGVQQLAYLELRYHNARERARTLMDSALVRMPLDSILPADRPYYELARFYAGVGDLPRARLLLNSADSIDRSLGRNRPADRSWTRGVLAFAAGRLPEAETELRQAAETHLCAMCPLPDLARAYEAAGKRDSAIVAYQRYLSTPWLWRYETDAVDLGWVMKRLGELYEEKGENAKATTAYSDLLQLWRHADRELDLVTTGVRRQLAQLTGGEKARSE